MTRWCLIYWRTRPAKYLVAVQSANQGDSIVLATGEPVLFMGGFNGGDLGGGCGRPGRVGGAGVT